MLGLSAISERALSEQPSARSGASDFAFSGAAYAYGATDFSFAAGMAGAVTGVGAATLDLQAAGVGTFTPPLQTATGIGGATLDLVPAAIGGHGVAGAGQAALDLVPAAAAGHGVAGAGQAALGITPAAVAGHGVAGVGAAGLSLTAAAVAVHTRYEVRGEVRQGGILVSRRVRAYLRSSGALLGQVDTVAGRFWIHTGFTPAEHYVVPIDLQDTAADYTPPTANRVLSVLAQDA